MFCRNCLHLAIVLVLLVSAAVCGQEVDGSADNAAQRQSYRVMSINIRYGTADDGPNRWDERKQLVVETIERFAPDLFGTQETWPFQAQYLQQELKRYAYVGKLREPDQDGGEQCGVFFRRDRFEDLEQGHFWLSKTPDVPGSKDWDSALPRMATWVKLFDRPSGRVLYLFNTHFDHLGPVARSEAANVLRDRIAGSAGQPVIVTGDFNCGEGSPPYRNLVTDNRTKVPLVDTLRRIRPMAQRGEGTFNGFTGRDLGARIDWILVSPEFHVESAEIVKHHRDGQYPSDHFPVTAVLTCSDRVGRLKAQCPER